LEFGEWWKNISGGIHPHTIPPWVYRKKRKGFFLFCLAPFVFTDLQGLWESKWGKGVRQIHFYEP